MKTLLVLFFIASISTIVEVAAEYYTGFEFHPDGYKLVTYANEMVTLLLGIFYGVYSYSLRSK